MKDNRGPINEEYNSVLALFMVKPGWEQGLGKWPQDGFFVCFPPRWTHPTVWAWLSALRPTLHPSLTLPRAVWLAAAGCVSLVPLAAGFRP